MKDHTHFLTKDGIIFTTRGNTHPKGYVRSIGIYYEDKKGKKLYQGRKFKKELEEFGDKWLPNIRQDYIRNDKLGKYILVPEKDIIKTFDPFSVFDRVETKIEDTKWTSLLNEIRKVVKKEDIGFIGSYLIDFPIENSDIDIIIKGKKNMTKIRDSMKDISENLNVPNDLNKERLKESLKRYHKSYNKNLNNFEEMIKRRWPTLRTDSHTIKLRFCHKLGEDKSVLPKKFIKEIETYGEVIDDEGTNFMPRRFTLKAKKGIFTVMTYFWSFAYCVKKGDMVKIKANLFDNNILVVGDKKNHGIRFKY
tara:strand:+ start:2874 stop:3794 length:921 start_codon:yes stop_codon:yes gene_type:complete